MASCAGSPAGECSWSARPNARSSRSSPFGPLESFAARLATTEASDGEIHALRDFFATFDEGELATHIDEYSEANLAFHQRILELSNCEAYAAARVRM
jgi:DNA-binding GntR family transcriptional regulator